MIQIYHNPRCGKSRNCLLQLEESKQEYKIIKYLEETPNFEELVSLIKKLQVKPIELVRTKESIWMQNFKGKLLTDDEIIQTMVSNPILIERPILIKEDTAIIGRESNKAANFLL